MRLNAKIEQTIYAVDSHRKRALLVRLLQQRDMSQVIVFCRTKQGADQLTRELKRENISVAAIHGDKAQQARIETLAAFKAVKCGCCGNRRSSTRFRYL